MLPELGHFALVTALMVALVQGILPLAGAWRGITPWMALARPAALVQCLALGCAFFALMGSFVAGDFSVVNVASHSNSELPLPYRIAATWGSHEGSMLLWAFLLALWSAAVALFARGLAAVLHARVLATMGLLSVGFLLFVLLTSNPFARLNPPALEGRDLNPLLQDPGMVLHPPLLYMGYVGFAVAFAFAVAALLEGRGDTRWARSARPWTLAAWTFLTLGITVGSWWAYYELGWGGWWFWDPVENASFMPWLVGTALVHSLAVADKRGLFKAWTVLLAIAAFSLSLLGTFLVRSGVLSSVHAFATDPARGLFILVFLAVVVGGSLALFGMRAARLEGGGGFAPLSREALLLANNLLLATAAGAVMLGTLYPLALDALNLGKISVGMPYFEAVFVPLMVPVVLLMGAAPLVRWKASAAAALAAQVKWAAPLAALAALALPALAGRLTWGIALGLFLAGWVLGTSVLALLQPPGGAGGVTGLARVRLRERGVAWWGMWLAHLGVAIFIIGVTVSRGYESERDVKLAIGEAVELGGWRFTLESLDEVAGPNYKALRATVRVADVESNRTFVMQPEKRLYKVQAMPTTEAAIDAGLTRDLFVSLGERLDERTWTLRVMLKPFIDWIWGGALFMAIGGLFALADRRYRRRAAASEPATAATAAAAV